MRKVFVTYVYLLYLVNPFPFLTFTFFFSVSLPFSLFIISFHLSLSPSHSFYYIDISHTIPLPLTLPPVVLLGLFHFSTINHLFPFSSPFQLSLSLPPSPPLLKYFYHTYLFIPHLSHHYHFPVLSSSCSSHDFLFNFLLSTFQSSYLSTFISLSCLPLAFSFSIIAFPRLSCLPLILFSLTMMMMMMIIN